eukprot:COSAG03_NODE_25245_length_267_cov_0.333333_1_plen_66_part_01
MSPKAHTQSIRDALSVLQDWVSMFRPSTAQTALTGVDSGVTPKLRVATPVGPHGSEHSLSSLYAPT